ncbi:MAG TPA: hypothetical protein O0X27_02100 [Methanocorpusculum sp.]|nr:hypothetical protein [Methanocorpusculum sp.]
MGKLRLVFLIVGLVLIIAGVSITFGLIPGVTWGSLAGSSSVPAAAPVSTVQPTAVSTPIPNADPLAGTWYGSKSLFFGFATADFTLNARPDGTMTISGVANAPIAEIENKEFSIDGTWQHLDGTTYRGTIGDKSLDFTSDGSTISLTVNPYAAGLIDNEMLNMDIDIALARG